MKTKKHIDRIYTVVASLAVLTNKIRSRQLRDRESIVKLMAEIHALADNQDDEFEDVEASIVATNENVDDVLRRLRALEEMTKYKE